MNKNADRKVRHLICELKANPVDFEDRGRGNELLSCYCSGAPLDSLRPLLSDHHISVRGTAMFVAAELGIGARSLIDDVTPLTSDSDPRITWDAMESVFVCALESLSDRFVFVVKQLENRSLPVRQHAMELIAKAYDSQLDGALSVCSRLGTDSIIHEKCLRLIVSDNYRGTTFVSEMLNSDTELITLYGAIIAKKLMLDSPQYIQSAASNADPAVRGFANYFLYEK